MAEHIVKTNEDGNIPFTSNGVKVCEEIIRCRDCGKRAERVEGLKCKHFSYQDKYGNLYEPFVYPDGFCAWAERDE